MDLLWFADIYIVLQLCWLPLPLIPCESFTLHLMADSTSMVLELTMGNSDLIRNPVFRIYSSAILSDWGGVAFYVSSTVLLEFAIDSQSCVFILLIDNPVGSLGIDAIDEWNSDSIRNPVFWIYGSAILSDWGEPFLSTYPVLCCLSSWSIHLIGNPAGSLHVDVVNPVSCEWYSDSIRNPVFRIYSSAILSDWGEPFLSTYSVLCCLSSLAIRNSIRNPVRPWRTFCCM